MERGLQEVEVRGVALDRFAEVIGPVRTEQFLSLAASSRERLAGRRVINVNSTATGGGVAELLQTLLAHARGVGIDTRWLVIEGDPAFFAITKRIHNHLYGAAGDGGPLGFAEREHYEATMRRNEKQLVAFVRPGDVVVLHDPQTAGLAPALLGAGVTVVWRCHVGIDTANAFSEEGWSFLQRYLDNAHAYVFSRAQFAPSWIDRERLAVIAPSIDPFSAKNAPIAASHATQLLQAVGLLSGSDGLPTLSFTRRDGTSGVVRCRVDLLDTGPPPPAAVPVVLQASRWDAMKDMKGVMLGFADADTDAHLVLAGPESRGVADDPEADDILRDCHETWARLPVVVRSRIHLACVPMDDGDEAATVVNALQRHATVVVQKSLAEGFGLTVTEAMWKARPVVASAVGGIVDQVVPGETGWLVDADDIAGYAAAVCALLADPPAAEHMGAAGYARAHAEFLGDRHLMQWARLFERLSA
ncbi:MAG TPA: glycosyltransferase [Acidimicrobiia bacterium]|nr:glycosyltransferase [Acidimicrobiia bacterium]